MIYSLDVTVPFKEVLLAYVAAWLKGCADCFRAGASAWRADFDFTGYALATLFVIDAVAGMALDIFNFVLHCKLPLF